MVLLINSHDTGTYIGPYRGNVRTPNLMGLASEGCLFTRAFATAPTCSPSRCSLFTSRFPHERGMDGLANMKFRLNSYDQTLVSLFNEAGYKTALAGVQHIAQDSRTIGYQYVVDKEVVDNNSLESYTAPHVLGSSYPWDLSNAQQIKEFIRSNKGENLFISYGLGNTHRSYDEAEAVSPYLQVPDYLPDTPQIRSDAANFYTSVSNMDTCIGELVDFIEEEGLEDETVMIYTTDHGIAFPGKKCTLSDSGTHISLIVKYPACRKGKRIDSLVSNIDLFPSICELCGIPVPDYVRGKSLKMAMESSGEVEVHKEVFSEINYHISYQPMRSIRTKRYRYTRYFHDYPFLSLANVDSGPTKSFFLAHGLKNVRQWKEALFDLYYDPGENRNLLECEQVRNQYKDVYEFMVRKMDEWMGETQDPLKEGPVPQPEGTKVWPNNCIDHDREIYR